MTKPAYKSKFVASFLSFSSFFSIIFVMHNNSIKDTEDIVEVVIESPSPIPTTTKTTKTIKKKVVVKKTKKKSHTKSKASKKK